MLGFLHELVQSGTVIEIRSLEIVMDIGHRDINYTVDGNPIEWFLLAFDGLEELYISISDQLHRILTM